MTRLRTERPDGEDSSRTAELLRAYHRDGDSSARDHLVEVYLPLVRSFARRYSRGSDDYDDLYQVGCIGLIQAIDRFELERGGEFAAYAVPNIAGEIRRYLRDRRGSVRLPRRAIELRRSALQARSELERRLGRAPTVAEVAEELGADQADVALALDARRASQASPLGDTAAGDAEPIDAVEDRVFLSEAFRGLGDDERRVLYLRYIYDLQPAEISRRLGMPPQQVSRIAQAALGKVRHELERTEPSSAPPSEPKMARMAAGHTVDEQYVEQPYHIELVRAGSGWRARVEEIPSCAAEGATHEEAVARLEKTMRDWIADAVAHGRDVPKPRTAASHSGRLLVRMPQSLHADLAHAAEREGISLNQFITSVLASAIGWRSDGSRRGGPSAASEAVRRRVLAANLAVLAVVGVVALALLVLELAQKL